MHHSLKKHVRLLLSFILVLTISGCFFNSPDIEIIKKEYETDSSTVKIEIPEFKNLSDQNFQLSLNDEYKNMIDSRLDEFEKNCPDSPLEKCEFSLSQEVKLKSERIISILGNAYIFTEGIHGVSERISKNIDISENKVLKLSDLFLDAEYPTAINREIEKIVKDNPDEYHDLWEKPILSSIHEECFYLTKKGLVIFYPPYELSYYSKGFVEFLIPYNKLTGYIKPKYNSI